MAPTSFGCLGLSWPHCLSYDVVLLLQDSAYAAWTMAKHSPPPMQTGEQKQLAEAMSRLWRLGQMRRLQNCMLGLKPSSTRLRATRDHGWLKFFSLPFEALIKLCMQTCRQTGRGKSDIIKAVPWLVISSRVWFIDCIGGAAAARKTWIFDHVSISWYTIVSCFQMIES